MGGQKPAFPNHGNIGAATNYWGASLLFKTQSMQCVNTAVFDRTGGSWEQNFQTVLRM